MIHFLLINRKHVIEVGMNVGSDEQDLVKALDSVADAAASVGGVPSTDNSSTTTTLDPTMSNVAGAVDSPFPPLIPSPSSDNQVTPSAPIPIPTPGPLPPNNETVSSNDPSNSNPFGIVAPTIPESPVPTPSDVSFEPAPVIAPTESTPSSDISGTLAEPTMPEVQLEATNAVDSSDPATSTEPVVPSEPAVNTPAPVTTAEPTTDTSPLASIKKDVLVELRPLVDKLNVSPEDKFDTLLLLIRSTDDSSLVEPAHEAAKAITDEARRAEALLEIVKEIDYLTRQKSDEA